MADAFAALPPIRVASFPSFRQKNFFSSSKRHPTRKSSTDMWIFAFGKNPFIEMKLPCRAFGNKF